MSQAPERYEPTLESIRQHPLPDWYQDAKLGIFVHWGLYSVPAFAASRKDPFQVIAEGGFDKYFRENPYAEWYLNTLKFADGPTRAYHDRAFGAGFAYEDFQPIFERESAKWVADDWARLFRDAGAGYVVLTAKHTDGYLLWPSRVGNLVRPGYQSTRDLVGELVAAVRERGLRAGLYYTGGMDWLLNPERIDEPQKIYSTILEGPKYAAYADAHWRELIERYRPSVLWGDIMYVRGADVAALFADYYDRVPDGVVNDRFATEFAPPKRPGMQPPGIHYDFLTPEYATFPDVEREKWETCRGISSSFGFNRLDDADSYLSADAVIRMLADIVSKNGNLLLNVGPRADGSIHELQRACLLGLGAWLAVNGEGIRGTRPWRRAESTTACGVPVRFTRGTDALYALLLDTPHGDEVRLRDLPVADGTTVQLLGHAGRLTWRRADDDLVVRLPAPISGQPVHALRIAPLPGA
ncbi:MAG TPA: alpha-L-fucosidase [Candidatus Binatia bacterium]|nr:alpha-L-fucosidase [Candidatus Binatia bacterium]